MINDNWTGAALCCGSRRLSLVTYHLSLVIGHWSFVVGHWSLVICEEILSPCGERQGASRTPKARGPCV
ncbi:MAG: hypothetical protein DMG09_15705 [Acidobacteria bacterium]|nr:MAG: hypothetical protein DMG09_15705 [Acidobacteriota bacterium]